MVFDDLASTVWILGVTYHISELYFFPVNPTFQIPTVDGKRNFLLEGTRESLLFVSSVMATLIINLYCRLKAAASLLATVKNDLSEQVSNHFRALQSFIFV